MDKQAAFAGTISPTCGFARYMPIPRLMSEVMCFSACWLGILRQELAPLLFEDDDRAGSKNLSGGEGEGF